MSSKPSGAAPASRCLFCNVGCPVRVMQSGPDHYLPDYVPHAGYAGLCGRGSVLVDLLDHPRRIHEAHRHTVDGLVPLDTQTAAREAAEALRAASPAAVIVDGNYGADALASVARFARASDARWGVLVPPGDAGLVRALDSSGCRFVGPEALEEADALVLVGDVFATHPVAAHWILAAKRKQTRMPLLVVADGSCVTASFASDLWVPDASGGGAGAVLAAAAKGERGWAESLKKAERPAIVIASPAGEASGLAAGRAAAELALATNASVCPLTTYGNAWGAMRVGASASATEVAEILASPPGALLLIGADVEAAFGPTRVGPALDRVRHLAYAGPMPNPTSLRASLAVPVAFPFEGADRALLGPGREVTFEPVLAPPAGVPVLRDVLMMAGGETAKADLSRPVESPQATPKTKAPDGDGLVVSLVGDPIHFADGSLTRQAAWPKSVEPEPLLVMAAADAEASGLGEADGAIIEGPGGSAAVRVVAHPRQQPGQARASAAFPEVRDVFGWPLGSQGAGEPGRVRVRKA